jgi:hypothetical protein
MIYWQGKEILKILLILSLRNSYKNKRRLKLMPRFYDPDTGKELVYTCDTADDILKANKLKEKVFKT